MLRGFSQVLKQNLSFSQSLMRVFGLLERMRIIKEGLWEMSQKIEESEHNDLASNEIIKIACGISTH